MSFLDIFLKSTDMTITIQDVIFIYNIIWIISNNMLNELVLYAFVVAQYINQTEYQNYISN